MEGCLACDLAEERIDLPGGRIFKTDLWIVEHCVGPIGIGTLVVKRNATSSICTSLEN
ncbi:MAG TPA: hypothetical protein VIM33_02100 [Gaiellaceae bacterium]